MKRLEFLGKMIVLSALTFPWVMSGCGPRDQAPQAGPTPTADDLKRELESVAKSGQGGSALGGVEAAMAALKTSQPELHGKLDVPFQSLRAATAPPEIKKLANQMLEIVNTK